MTQPWAVISVPYMNHTILGLYGLGFLNQVPRLSAGDHASGALGVRVLPWGFRGWGFGG